MFHFVVTTGFKYVVEANEVALDIGIGISYAITDTCLSCKIHNNSDIVLCEYLFYCVFTSYRSMHKCPITIQCLDFFQTLIFDVDIIVVGDRIYTDNFNVLNILKRRLTRLLPIKPAAPVTRTVLPSILTLYSTISQSLLKISRV